MTDLPNPWTPTEDFVRAMYSVGRHSADPEVGMEEREAEFNRWVSGERRANVLSCISELMYLRDDFNPEYSRALNRAIHELKSTLE